jgi:transcriptional regulator
VSKRPKRKQDLAGERMTVLRGTLDMLVLSTLGDEPMHGYAIAMEIQEATDDVLRVEEGSLYPALYRMEKKGWVSSSWGRSEANRRARYYRLTAAGHRRLSAEQKEWERAAAAIASILRTT